jgi:hypothetical protein
VTVYPALFWSFYFSYLFSGQLPDVHQTCQTLLHTAEFGPLSDLQTCKSSLARSKSIVTDPLPVPPDKNTRRPSLGFSFAVFHLSLRYTSSAATVEQCPITHRFMTDRIIINVFPNKCNSTNSTIHGQFTQSMMALDDDTQ